MQALFSPPGLAALLQLMRRHALLAFDFDGTLAPIVAHPPDARVPAAMALQLATLAACLPTAIITGRSVADVTPLLGFNPRYIIGNHGAEEAGRPLPPATVKPLEGLRRKIGLHTAELHQTGVEVEDKQQSFALHYRLAADHKKALDAIGDVLRGMDPALGFFGGKFVVNIVMANAPHKGDAMHDLIRRCGADE